MKLHEKCGTYERTPRGECRACDRERRSSREHLAQRAAARRTAHGKAMQAARDARRVRSAESILAARESMKRRAADPAWRKARSMQKKSRYNNDPELRKAISEKGRASRYGVPVEALRAMLRKQKGACAICGDDLQEGKNMHVDHDHKNGVVRALLCPGCNVGLGCFKDSPVRLRQAARYLVRHGATP